MSAITVTHGLPPTIIALSEETINTRDELLDRCFAARKPGIIDAESHPNAAAVFKEMSAFASAVEKQRKELKAPILDVGRKLDAAAEEALAPIIQERAELGKLVAVFEASERRRVEEEQRAAREAARQAEIAERARQEAELKARAELEAPPGEEPKPIDVEEIKVRPILPQRVETFKGVTKTTVKKKAHIVDASKIPTRLNDIPLVKEWDMTAITMLLKAGVPVPGCELVEETYTGATGR